MNKRVIRGPEPYDMPEEMHPEIERMTQEAEADVEELRVNT